MKYCLPNKENIYHRYLNIGFDYQRPLLLDSLPKQWLNCMLLEHVMPELHDYLAGIGLTVSQHIDIFFTSAGGIIDIHSDSYLPPGQSDVCKLNFTWGPKNSVTRWYKIKHPKFLIKDCGIYKEQREEQFMTDEFKGIHRAMRDHVDQIYEAVIDRPSILNVGQLHDTFNPGPEERWTLSFLLEKNKKIITFDQAMEIFQDYIVE